ncbi:alpha/beta fold hydrolase [Chloroflexota bacterium]
MNDRIDLSPLDRPEILEVIFPILYSPAYLSENLPFFSPDVPSYSIDVEPGISIKCGFWKSNKEAPTILYFHGNGETIAGQEWIAPFYNQRGINLFAADYRGYGSSDGKPTISNMIGDAHIIFQSFKEIINKEGFRQSLFLMGRSLGSIPAVELAFNYQDKIGGLIVESGTANNFPRLWSQIGISGTEPFLSKESPFRNKIKMRQIKVPSLIIHGEVDEIISVEEGKELYLNSAAQDKRILIIPGADHNDIMVVDLDMYFGTIEEFIKTNA